MRGDEAGGDEEAWRVRRGGRGLIIIHVEVADQLITADSF